MGNEIGSGPGALTARYTAVIRALPEFLHDLRSSGMVVGAGQETAVVDLLLRLAATDRLPASLPLLGSYLAPIVCRSADEQSQFARRFIVWFGEWNQGEAAEQPRVVEPAPEDTAAETEPAPARPRQLSVWKWRAIAAAAVLAFGLSLTLRPGLRPAPRTAAPGTPVTAPAPTGGVPQNVPATPALVEPKSPWAWLLLNLPFVLVALWIVWPARSDNAFIVDERLVLRGALLELLLSAETLAGSWARALEAPVRRLRTPRPRLSADLDIERTVEATAANAGMLVPIRKTRGVTPEYLALVERLGPKDHQACLFHEFLKAFREGGVYLDTQWYVSDPRVSQSSPHAGAVSLDVLAGRYATHTAIVMGSPERFVQFRSGLPEPWTKVFRAWERFVLMTPNPRGDWGNAEDALARLGSLELVSPDSAGLDALSSPAEQPRTEVRPAVAVQSLIDTLDSERYVWLDPSPPAKERVAELVRQLKEGLPADSFLWVCACAVFPRLEWPVTWHIGQKLEITGSVTLANPVILLNLIRLPWFREGWMPAWLRVALLQELSADVRIRVHQILDDLLFSVSSLGRRDVLLNVAIDRQQAAYPRGNLAEMASGFDDDPVLIEFLRSARTRPGSFRLSARVARALGLPARDILRDLRAGLDMDHMRTRASVLAELLEQAGVGEALLAKDSEAAKRYGVDFEQIQSLRPESRLLSDLAEELYVYRPYRSETWHAVDKETLEILRSRRRLALRTAAVTGSIIAAVLTTLYDAYFQSSGPFLGVLATMLLVIAPFWLYHRLLVRPVFKRLSAFPAVSVVTT